MQIVRRARRAVVAVALVVCLCASARAQGVLDQVPADAWVVMRVNKLEQTNKKVAAWAEAMGIAQMSPEMADPLGALERQANIKGLDKSRDMAFVMMNPAGTENDPEKSILILLPTNDYKALAASLPNAKTEGALTTFNASEDGADEEEKGFAANWGAYAAISPTQALVSKKPGGLKLTGLAAKEMQSKDAVIYANIPAMRSKLLPELKKAREEARKQFQAQMGGGNPGAETTTTTPAATNRPGAAPAARPAQRPGGAGTTPPPGGRRQGTTPGNSQKGREPQSLADDAAVVELASFQQQPARRPAQPAPGADAEEDANASDDDATTATQQRRPGQPGAPAGGGDPAEAMKQYVPAIQAMMEQYFAFAERVLTDGNAAVFSINLTDEGLNTTMAAEFTQGSYLGKIASGMKNTDANLLAGLPGERPYFGFGGMHVSPDVMSQLVTDMMDPVLKQLAGTGQGGQNITQMVNAAKTMLQNTKTSAFGYPAPQGALGTESVIQAVSVSTGNAKAIADSQKTMLKGMNSLMQGLQGMQGQAAGAEGQPPVQMNFQVQEGAKAVGGVKLDAYKVDMQMDAENNPQAAQAQQMMAMVYGPNGMSGVLGAVNDKTFIAVQGGTDQLIEATVKSAQNPQDRLSGLAQVKAVSGQLPQNRFGVFYLQLDQIVSTGTRYAQGFGMPLKMQLPQNLPPIGFSAASEGTALRFDTHVPTTTIQSIVAAGMQAYMQMQGGGAGAPGAPEGL